MQREGEAYRRGDLPYLEAHFPGLRVSGLPKWKDDDDEAEGDRFG